VVGVAYASLPGGFTATGCPIGVLASFIMEASSEFVCQYYAIHSNGSRRYDRGHASPSAGGLAGDRGQDERALSKETRELLAALARLK
jgi:hypothetical protein